MELVGGSNRGVVIVRVGMNVASGNEVSQVTLIEKELVGVIDGLSRGFRWN